MRLSTRVLAVFALSVLAPLSAWAQGSDRPGFQSVGAYAGAELDNPSDWFLVGFDTRIVIGTMDLEGNPRFTYRPFNGGSVVQIDANVLHNYELARPGRFKPYVGVGGALRHISIDGGPGDTSVGLNLISGTRLDMGRSARYEPFFNAQYTIIHGQQNPFTLSAGVSFALR